MKQIFGAIRQVGLVVTGVAFIYIIILYGFDISFKPKGRVHPIVALFTNRVEDNHFYKINDELGFVVETDFLSIGKGIDFVSYDRADFPFCLTCGWNKPTREVYIPSPYQKGDLIYRVDVKMDKWDGPDYVPVGTYITYNIATGEKGYVEELEEIAPDAADEKYKIGVNYISTSFEEISFSGSDDVDCIEAFMTVYALVVLFGGWTLIVLVVNKIKSRRA